jgi:predicted RNA-binding protein associated with RNAse of E/G family
LWRAEEHLIDYRFERLSDLLVERATWDVSTPVRDIHETVVADAGYIWFRFWMLREETVVEKYFRDDGEAVGFFAPICLPFADSEYGLGTTDLTLAIWIDRDGQVTVLGERQFESDVAKGLISPKHADIAEERIRHMTLAIGQNLFPPAIIRNFELNLG